MFYMSVLYYNVAKEDGHFIYLRDNYFTDERSENTENTGDLERNL